MIFETFERVLDLSKAGTRIVLPVQKFTRATVQVDGTGATLSGVVNMRRGNLSPLADMPRDTCRSWVLVGSGYPRGADAPRRIVAALA